MSFMKRFHLLVHVLLLQRIISAADPFQVLYGWRTVDFSYRGLSSRRTAEDTGAYIPGNALPLDMDVWKNRLFLALPRLKPGIPATLATVPLNSGSRSAAPKLDPYPSWTYNREGNCKGLTSVFRITIDRTGRLWVPDSGTINALGRAQQICPPELLIYDLNKDRMIKRYKFPESNLIPGRSLLSTIAVDIRDDPEEAFAYIADHAGYGLVVYDYVRDTSWRVNHNYFYPFPLNGMLTINGETISMMDGVTSLALSALDGARKEDRVLYFHSLAGVKESWVPTPFLQNETLSTNPNYYTEFKISDYERPSQSSVVAMDKNGIMFYGLLERNSLACWNSKQPYQGKYMKEIHKDDVGFIFPSGIKTDEDQNLWIITTRVHSYALGTLNNADVNFRVLMAPISQLLSRGVCGE